MSSPRGAVRAAWYEGFLREYILQLNKYGYQNAPFELEAEEKSEGVPEFWIFNF